MAACLPITLRKILPAHRAVLFLLVGVPVLQAGRVYGQEALFRDVTVDAGVDVSHHGVEDVMKMGVGTGAAWFDFDRDGDLDLYVTQGQGPNLLFVNQGDGSFVERAGPLEAQDALHAGAGVAVADFDNDGWPDLYLANAGPDVLLRDSGGERFVDVTAEMGLEGRTPERATGAAWGDYDGDGYLDLYVVSHMGLDGLGDSSRDRLFRNEGGAGFREVTHLLDPDLIDAYGFAATWTDYDRDGDVDLLVVNDCPFGDAERYRPTVLYRNDGGTFTNVAADVGAEHCRHGMGVAAGDYNNDGWTDYFYTNIGARTTLLRNQGGVFDDAAEEAGVLFGYNPRDPHGPFGGTYSWGANFVDVDLDGWLDLYVTAGTLLLTTNPEDDPQPNALFRNRGDGTFEQIPDAGGASSTGRSRTSIYGDYDGDGRPDLFVLDVGGEGRLFRNEASAGGYLIVDLVGTVSNRDGIGARVTVILPDGSRQVRELKSGSSLGGTNDIAAYFGIGPHDSVTELRIEWPSGLKQVLTDVEGSRRIVVSEPAETAIERHDVPREETVRLEIYPHPARFPLVLRISPLDSTAMGHNGTLAFFDVNGRLLHQLVVPAGNGSIRWDGQTGHGRRMASGIYLARLIVGETAVVRPFVVRP